MALITLLKLTCLHFNWSPTCLDNAENKNKTNFLTAQCTYLEHAWRLYNNKVSQRNINEKWCTEKMGVAYLYIPCKTLFWAGEYYWFLGTSQTKTVLWTRDRHWTMQENTSSPCFCSPGTLIRLVQAGI